MKIDYPSNYPEENRPIGAWKYFGLEILYVIPVVGLICAIFFAITNKNNHMRNFAKATIIKRILLAILYVLYFSFIFIVQSSYR